MTEEQSEFWQVVVMHFAIAGFVLYNAAPYAADLPSWLIVVSTVAGATGGLLKARHSQLLHLTHRPSLVRGVVEGVSILVLVYGGVNQLEALAPELRWLAFGAVLLAVPAWFTAYATYMLVEAYGASDEQMSGF